jgi:hypothetical protein
LSKSKLPKTRRKGRGLAVAGIIIAVIASLIYFEQIAILYVLATLALVTLLLIVALADLESVGEGDRLEIIQARAQRVGSDGTRPSNETRATDKKLKTAEVLNVDY